MTWTVIDASYATVRPIEEWLEAHRQFWSPNTVRGYATGLAQRWTFLEQRDQAAEWTTVGAPAVAGFLSWLRNGRTVEHAITPPELPPAAGTLEARLAALISFYRWHGSVNGVEVAERLLRGAPRRGPAVGLLSHLDERTERGSSSLVSVRTVKRSDRPPLLLPRHVQSILGRCAVYDSKSGEWQGNLRDRFLFGLLAETGMRLGEEVIAERVGVDLDTLPTFHASGRGQACRRSRAATDLIARSPRFARFVFARANFHARSTQEAGQPKLSWHAIAQQPFTDRQREIISLAAQGLSNMEIADRLTMSIRSVEGHLFRASQRVGANSREQLITILRGF